MGHTEADTWFGILDAGDWVRARLVTTDGGVQVTEVIESVLRLDENELHLKLGNVLIAARSRAENPWRHIRPDRWSLLDFRFREEPWEEMYEECEPPLERSESRLVLTIEGDRTELEYRGRPDPIQALNDGFDDRDTDPEPLEEALRLVNGYPAARPEEYELRRAENIAAGHAQAAISQAKSLKKIAKYLKAIRNEMEEEF